jgi:hypothetical protein
MQTDQVLGTHGSGGGRSLRVLSAQMGRRHGTWSTSGPRTACALHSLLEKRKVGGSIPPLTTSQPATCGPVTRPNVTCYWTCSTAFVAAVARSRPLFAVRWGTRGARRMILSVRTIGGEAVGGRSGKSDGHTGLDGYGRRRSGCCTLVLHPGGLSLKCQQVQTHGSAGGKCTWPLAARVAEQQDAWSTSGPSSQASPTFRSIPHWWDHRAAFLGPLALSLRCSREEARGVGQDLRW